MAVSSFLKTSVLVKQYSSVLSVIWSHCFINNEYKLHVDLQYCKLKLYSKQIPLWKANETYPFWVHSTLEDKCIYFFYNAFAFVENLKWN